MKPSILVFLIIAFCIQSFSQQDKTFPAQYDLRTYGFVTPVKDQGNCGCCWAFATMASIESNWLKQGFGTFDLSEDNLINCQNYDNTPCYGGNFYMSSSMFGRYAGPITEALDPYGDTTSVKNCPTGPFGGLTPLAYTPDVRFLPNDISIIKQAIMDHGAVATTMFFDMGSYNAANYTYLYNGTGGYPHSITVVGWDDNMNTASTNPGAWIIKDSYGTSWANAGYFYISFDDPIIFTEAAIFPVRYPFLSSNNTSVYYYDEFGWITDVGFSTTTGYSLAHFIIGETTPSPVPQQIKRIGTYAVEANTNLEVEVYDSFDGSNLSGLRYQTSMTCDFAGFYTLPIDLEADTNGHDVYIKVKYQTPSTNTPIPVEAYEANYTTNIVLQSGRNWMSGDGNTWYAVGNNTNWAFDLCVKMYTETAPLADFIMQDTAIIHEPVSILSDCFPPDIIDSLKWFVNNTYMGSEPLLNHAFTIPGDNTVKLVAYMGVNSDEEEKTIYIKNPSIMSIDPNVSMQGDYFTAYIQGFETSWMGSPDVSMSYSGNPGEIINGSNITVIDQQTLEADFDIPENATIGYWDLHVNNLIMEDGFYVDIMWDINEESFPGLKIFPCPTMGDLSIMINEKAEYSIISASGSCIRQGHLQVGSNNILLNDISKGVYILNIKAEKKSIWRKLILR